LKFPENRSDFSLKDSGNGVPVLDKWNERILGARPDAKTLAAWKVEIEAQETAKMARRTELVDLLKALRQKVIGGENLTSTEIRDGFQAWLVIGFDLKG